MKNRFHKVRFTLFIHSYSGEFLIKYLRNSLKTDLEIKKLGKVLLLNKDLLYHSVLLNKDSHEISTTKELRNVKESKEKIAVYMRIEKEMCILDEEKKDKERPASIDYERALLLPAIERVAGNDLAKIKNDREFDQKLTELYRIYNNWYYWVAYRYRLPTIRILPYILRLIQL